LSVESLIKAQVLEFYIQFNNYKVSRALIIGEERKLVVGQADPFAFVALEPAAAAVEGVAESAAVAEEIVATASDGERD